MGTLISTPGTRFPRAVREPPRRFAPVGAGSLGHAFLSRSLEHPLQSTGMFFLEKNCGQTRFSNLSTV